MRLIYTKYGTTSSRLTIRHAPNRQPVVPNICEYKFLPEMTPSKRVKLSSEAGSAASSSPQRPLAATTARTPTRHGDENWDPKHQTMNNRIQEMESDAFLDEDDDYAELEHPRTPVAGKPSPSRPGRLHADGQGYDALKSFNGQVYKGMAVGGSHTWNYDPGVWRETKVEPDLWQIDYETIKKRVKNAPQGSGAPVGTEYHWLIVAHQYVKKVDANTYETHLSGSKYKLCHKNASSNSWSIPTVKVQRDREIELLDDAKRRVQGLPPVHASEKVKVERKEKGQQKLDSLFSKAVPVEDNNKDEASKKRKRDSDS